MLNVVIVDDEKSARDIIRKFGNWEKLNLTIAGEATDGEEAIRLVASLKPDILITDMNMPGIDGVELLQQVTENHKNIKSIVLSGYDEFEYMKQAIRSGVIEYLLKPVDSVELNAALGRCIQTILKEKEKTIDYSKLVNTNLLPVLNEFKGKVSLCFSGKNIDELKEEFDQLLHDIKSLFPESSENIAFKLYNEFLFIAEEQIYKNNLELHKLFEQEKFTYFPDNSLEELFEQFLKLFTKLIIYLKKAQQVKGRFKLEEIKEYIEKNFTEPDISLGKLANNFFVSKEYLSKSFKEEYGKNITEFIVELRMVKAKELLKKGKYKIKNISEMIGYEDVSYFYRVFKKFYGIPPGKIELED